MLLLVHDLRFLDLNYNGDVRVNWTTVTKNGTTLKTDWRSQQYKEGKVFCGTHSGILKYQKP
ncbi:hypothetical protein CXB51_034247 [Gossypium anomalum]|uniref:Uncharacterized protein n=1 Tax=Gossypium anomalum TaxID=47600 RepID=A0A8J6CJE1_9ROSI|nr:hypothetical protein CXB51_034247 [Gossypium anomalum]